MQIAARWLHLDDHIAFIASYGCVPSSCAVHAPAVVCCDAMYIMHQSSHCAGQLEQDGRAVAARHAGDCGQQPLPVRQQQAGAVAVPCPLRFITKCIKIAAVSCTAAHGAAAEWACDRLQLALTLWQVAMACATEFVLPSKTASCCLTGHSGGGAAGVGRPHDGAHGGPGAAR